LIGRVPPKNSQAALRSNKACIGSLHLLSRDATAETTMRRDALVVSPKRPDFGSLRIVSDRVIEGVDCGLQRCVIEWFETLVSLHEVSAQLLAWAMRGIGYAALREHRSEMINDKGNLASGRFRLRGRL
jgi:hypothetical protein